VLAALNVNICVASNSPAELIRERLTQTNLIGYFPGRIFSAYDIGAWKPDPGLFMWAARTVGYPAQRCLVIEDSAVGVEAAVAAGMRVLQFLPGGGPPHAGAAMAFSDMADLPGLIGRAALGGMGKRVGHDA
jgi:beta-phosphoglucomutase-like phosphatase (HAD superfamily)